MSRYVGSLFFMTGFAAVLAGGWIGFPAVLYERLEQPLQFSHLAHVDGAGMECQDCHTFTASGRFTGIPTTKSCAECHDVMLGDTEAERILVEEYVAKNREIEWLVYSRQPENVYFSHVHHVKGAELECEVCHGPHGTTETLRPLYRNRISGYSRDIWGSHIARIGMESWEGAKMSDCARCHRDQGVVESCLTCHK
jgi:menaquinone reductase, multiheme cytochrome c subunit